MFKYIHNELHLIQNEAEPIRLKSLNINRPTYINDIDDALERYQFISETFQGQTSIHYALKANNSYHLLKKLAQAGCGADVVSGGELERALECGIPAYKIVFSGVGKSHKELKKAILADLKQINIESLPELFRVAHIARELQKRPAVALRVNPDVHPETHPSITTGFRDNKFGVDFKEIESWIGDLKKLSPSVNLVGLTLHIGSQILDPAPFLEAIQKTLCLLKFLNSHDFNLKRLDIGGGFGIHYHAQDQQEAAEKEKLEFKKFAKKVIELLKPFDLEILCEPGRFIVGHSSVLVAQIEYIKRTPYKNFVILNTGMHHFMRPALYEAYHRIEPLHKNTTAKKEKFDIVGPICESTDVLGRDRLIEKSLTEGDSVVIFDVGAYGAVMMNSYNLHEPPQEIHFYKGRQI